MCANLWFYKLRALSAQNLAVALTGARFASSRSSKPLFLKGFVNGLFGSWSMQTARNYVMLASQFNPHDELAGEFIRTFIHSSFYGAA